MTYKVETTHDDIHELAELLDKKRSANVKVRREVLWRIFRDHANLCRIARPNLTGDL